MRKGFMSWSSQSLMRRIRKRLMKSLVKSEVLELIITRFTGLMEGSRENIDRMTDLKKINVIFSVYLVGSLPKFFVFTFQLHQGSLRIEK